MRASTRSTFAPWDWGPRRPQTDHSARRFFALAVFVACLLAVATAAAQAAAPEKKSVDLLLAGPSSRVESMEHALAEPLGRLAVNVRSSRADAVDPKSVIDPSAERSDAFVRVWVDVSADDRVTLYFVDAAWERILVRHVPTPNALDEVEREEIAQIVRSAVEALLGGAKLGITRDEARAELLPKPPPPPPPPAPKPAERRPARAATAPPQPHSLGVDAGAFYEGEVYAGSLWHGPGLIAGVERRDELAWGGRVTLQYRTPVTIEGDHLGARLQALAMRALARGEWSTGGFGVSAAAGAGLDLTLTDPVPVGGQAVAGDSKWDAVPVARLLGGAGYSGGGVGVWPVVGLDVDLIEVRHVGVKNGRKYTVFEVSRARPFVGLELTVAPNHD